MKIMLGLNLRTQGFFAAYAALIAGGCGLEIEDRQREVPEVDVAVGATIELRLEWACSESDAGRTSTRCIRQPPESLEEAEIKGGAFDLLDSERQGDTLVFRIKAKGEGESTLVVTYGTGHDRGRRERVKLRAAEITRVEPEVQCDHEVEGLSSFPLYPGAEIQFLLQAYNGSTPLNSGDLELVEDYGGIPVDALDDGGYRSLRAPDQPGVYEWHLVGANSPVVTFPVYTEDEVGVALFADNEVDIFDNPPGLVVLPGYEGAPSCKHQGDARAVVEVTDGACRPVVDGFAIEGAFAVDISDGPLRLPLDGGGLCTATATDEHGRSTDVELDPEPWMPVLPTGDGAVLSGARDVSKPLATHEPCKQVTSLASGTCDILDGAGLPLPNLSCLSTWEWKVRHRDGTVLNHQLPPSGTVGVGLQSELHARIDYDVLGFNGGEYAPYGLSVSTPSGLSYELPGCVDEKQASIIVVASQEADFAVDLSATNIKHDKTVEVRARTIADVVYATEAGQGAPGDSESFSYVFPGLELGLEVAYLGANGEELGGTAPLWVSSDNPSAMPAALGPSVRDSDHGDGSYGDAYVFTGLGPNTITVSSDASDDEHQLRVVDAASVAMIAGVDEQSVRVGNVECLRPRAETTDGWTIYGRPLDPPVLAFEGAPLLLEMADDPDDQMELCMVGYEPGDVALTLRMDEASAEATWTVD